MKTLTVFWIVLLGISVLVSGCDNKSRHTDALNAKINSTCIVCFNHQAIGEIPSEDKMPFFINSDGISVTGTLKQVTKEWIVLECELADKSMNLWIPRNVVLWVRTDFKIGGK